MEVMIIIADKFGDEQKETFTIYDSLQAALKDWRGRALSWNDCLEGATYERQGYSSRLQVARVQRTDGKPYQR